MSLIGFIKGTVEVISAIFKGIIYIFQGIGTVAKEINHNFDEWEKKRTFSDLRDAIAFVAENKGSWATLNNDLQYNWLLQYQEIDGYKVSVVSNPERNDKPELKFNYIHNRKHYFINIIPSMNDIPGFTVYVFNAQEKDHDAQDLVDMDRFFKERRERRRHQNY